MTRAVACPNSSSGINVCTYLCSCVRSSNGKTPCHMSCLQSWDFDCWKVSQKKIVKMLCEIMVTQCADRRLTQIVLILLLGGSVSSLSVISSCNCHEKCLFRRSSNKYFVFFFSIECYDMTWLWERERLVSKMAIVSNSKINCERARLKTV